MNILDRFIEYVKIDTTSDPYSNEVPSSAKQLVLAELLHQQLKIMGIETKLDKGYVYGSLPSNLDYDCKTIGLVAHMDTSPDYSGANIKPRVIEKWDGTPIKLDDQKVLSINIFEKMKHLIGDDIVVTDGSTLLGADDKAGIAIIMNVLQELTNNPTIKHGNIKVCFTPDEEIGRGADHFDVTYFNADFAYTLDGGLANEFCYETFNAYGVDVNIKGVSIHPGSAKNKMVNALTLANRFDNLLPAMARPEYTEGFEGFNHLHSVKGNAESCEIEYIVRNHDKELIAKQLNDFERIANYLNEEYGYEAISLTIKLQYQNMYEKLHDQKEIIDLALNAITKQGLTADVISARGGTDGAMLTFMGLPCPNLGTGSLNCHGPYECCSVNEMEQIKSIVLTIIDDLKGVK